MRLNIYSLFVTLLLLCFCICEVHAMPRQIRTGDIVLNSLDSLTWIDSRAFDDLKSGLESLSLAEKTVVLTEDATLSNDLSAGTYTGLDILVKKGTTLKFDTNATTFDPSITVEDGGQVDIDVDMTFSGMLRSLGNKQSVTPFDANSTVTFNDATLDTGSSPLPLFSADTVGAGQVTNPTVYPQWFGAVVGDDTDDTQPILSAITVLPSDGGTVYFPQGTYKVYPTADDEDCIDVPYNNISVIGAGKGSTKIDSYAPGGTDPDSLADPSSDWIGSVFYFQSEDNATISNIEVSGLEFDGNCAYTEDDWNTSNKALRFETNRQFSRINIHDNYFHNFRQECIYLAGSTATTLQDLRVHNNLFEDSTQAATAMGGSFYNNHVYSCDQAFEIVYFNGCQLDIHNNYMYDTYQESVSVRYFDSGAGTGATFFNCHDNISDTPTRRGFLIQDLKNAHFHDNSVLNPAASTYPAIDLRAGYSSDPYNLEQVVCEDNVVIANSRSAYRGIRVAINTGYNATAVHVNNNVSILSQYARDNGYTFTSPVEIADRAQTLCNNWDGSIKAWGNYGYGTTYRDADDLNEYNVEIDSSDSWFDIVSYDNPTRRTSFIVNIYYKTTATTDIKIAVSYRDLDETNEYTYVVDNGGAGYTSVSAGDYSVSTGIIAHDGLPVKVRAMAGTASQLYVSAELLKF